MLMITNSFTVLLPDFDLVAVANPLTLEYRISKWLLSEVIYSLYSRCPFAAKKQSIALV